MALIVLPRPKRMEEGPGAWRPGPEFLESVESTFTTRPAGVEYTENLTGANAADNGDAKVSGSYRLEAGGRGIKISAADDEGRRNALVTLKQICRQTAPDGSLPEVLVVDSPSFAVRGVMLDVSRTRVPTMSTLRNLADLFAELKYNQLQLYIEHTFAYRGHEKVWKDASPFTGDEIEEIDAYCRERCIELVPNQNSIGHMERWLRHPEYHHLAEAPGGFTDPGGVFREFASTLDAANPQSLIFLKDLYDQLLPHFRSRTFNIGGDEPYDLGKGKNAGLCEKIGTGRFYLGFLNSIVTEVERRGYKAQFWADIILNHPELLKDVPQNAVVMNWGYEANHPFEKETAAIARSGRMFQVCPGTSSWNSIAGRWTNARENIRSAANHGLANNASGFLVTDWGDNGYKQQYAAALPGWAAAAAAGWNGPTGADEDVEGALQVHVFRKKDGHQAGLLLRLANLYLENPVVLHNMSFLMLPLLDHEYPYYRGLYKDIRLGGMGKAEAVAGDVLSNLGKPGNSTWDRQLAFTAAMMSFAADLAGGFYSSEDFNIGGLNGGIRKSLAGRLDALMTSYSDLWQNYCRPGGLEESLGGFLGLMKLLKG